MKFTCIICKEKSSKTNCCKYINNILYKFCNRCGTVDEKKGWYIYTNFVEKKKKSLTGYVLRQKICINCRNKKLKYERKTRTLQGIKPRKTENDDEYELRYFQYLKIQDKYIEKYFDEDYHKSEITYLK